MITKFSKWILYISSYIPLYLIFIISNCFDVYSKYIAIKDNENFNVYLVISTANINLIIVSLFSGLIIISLFLLIISLRRASKSTEYHNFYSVKKNNQKVNEYILVYIIPFITVKSNDCKELTVFALLFALIGIISVKNDLVYVNPILYIMKYNIYLFKESQQSIDEIVLISQYSIIELKQIGNWDSNNNTVRIRASNLSDRVYLIKK